MTQFDVIIIGAGAAGLMCAIEAGRRGRKVLVLDKARKAGAKILISGGGRCNFTNMHAEAGSFISGNPHFIKSALARFSQWDFIAMVDNHGIPWHEKTLGQLFCDNKATDIVGMLLEECAAVGVDVRLQCSIESVAQERGFHVNTDAEAFSCDSLVVASGGLSIPGMGSTGLGYDIAKQFDIPVTSTLPALVPFTLSKKNPKAMLEGLSGISLDVRISCNEVSFSEALLITHKGLSGPAVLQISSYWRAGQAIEIDLLPGIDAEAWLNDKLTTRPKALLSNVLPEVLPKRLAQRFCETLLPNKSLNQLSTTELGEIASLLNGWTLTPDGTEGYRTAEVTLGGVDTQALSSKTMEANAVTGLYFIGEVVDVTGWLGGYNFQWAWASGWCAGQVA